MELQIFYLLLVFASGLFLYGKWSIDKLPAFSGAVILALAGLFVLTGGIDQPTGETLTTAENQTVTGNTTAVQTTTTTVYSYESVNPLITRLIGLISILTGVYLFLAIWYSEER